MTPRVMSYSIIHYGKDYLPYSLRSISPFVEKSYIFYTPHPSHGHRSELQPIETREEIMASIPASEWDKLVWVDTENFWNEGPQRDWAVKTSVEAGADIILVADYDEIFSNGFLEKAIEYIWKENKARNWLCNMFHFWRSFEYVCTDDNWPVRFIDTRHINSKENAYIDPKEIGQIYHFGYAVTDKVMNYKWSCHGHYNELRPNWFEEKWNVWPPVEDCHPTNGRKENGQGWWNPVLFDKTKLPEIMRHHPYWNVEPIK